MIYSFDVFDTLITRTTANPTGIFAIMQKRIIADNCYSGLPEFVKKYFFQIRVNAENEARQTNLINKQTAEVKFNDIYNLMQFMHGFSDEERELLKQLELDIEKENCLPIWTNINRIKEYKKNDDKVFLISDMYHSEETIRELLVQFDICFEDIPILVSCNYNKSKASGDLFDWFICEYEIMPGEWLHVGDNIVSDSIQVEVRGGKAELHPVYQYSSFESDLINKHQTEVSFQLALGAIKNSRLGGGDYEIGRRVTGPILYGYSLWVLECARKHNISSLYYIARDGYILKIIADIIIKANKWNIKTHYLYGSRKSWQLPAAARSEESLLDWFEHKCRSQSVDELCGAIGMEREELFSYLPSIISKETNILNYAESLFIKKSLMENNEFIRAVCKNAQVKRQSAIDYLKQEIDISESYAFVELNGTGYTQQCLSELIENAENKIVSFFYRIANVTSLNLDKNKYYKYTYERFEIDDILEPLCRAPHGMTTGYEIKDGQWIPVLCKYSRDYPEYTSYQNYIDGIKEFTAVMSSSSVCDGIDLHAVAIEYIHHICRAPEEDVLSYIGDIPFISWIEQGNSKNEFVNDCQSYAPHLTESELKRIYLYGDSEWFERKYTFFSRNYMQLRLTAHDKELIDLYKNIRCRLRVKPPKAEIDKVMFVKGKFVIYGAGIRGKRVFEQLIKLEELELVAWVDRDYKNCISAVFDISNPEELPVLEFDALIIAVANRDVVLEIKEYLGNLGIPSNKIYDSGLLRCT